MYFFVEHCDNAACIYYRHGECACNNLYIPEWFDALQDIHKGMDIDCEIKKQINQIKLTQLIRG